MLFSAFDTNFSNQGVWLLTFQIKESQWKLRRAKLKKSKIHAHYYVVFHGSLDWGLKVCILILLISYKLDLKRVLATKKWMNQRFVTCFCDVAIHIIAVSRRLHSSNQYAFMVKKYRKCWFWKLRNHFWRTT